MHFKNPIQTGLFFIFSDPVPLRTSRIFKQSTMKLGGYIVCPKIFRLIYATWNNDVISRKNYVMISKLTPSWIKN